MMKIQFIFIHECVEQTYDVPFEIHEKIKLLRVRNLNTKKL
ncbi:hypothetical protein C414_000230025 [Campylobacter jejuni subsp. jejuni 414]|nr:hypothetical protein C414_000230025 [Campylobacter jejuni subsp. jejuni 414]